nr:immunoglobulin heavy chain junction region [Macaca mulatta]MOY28717.1 immunoglobulin heavy chain junction region [Macaca mulatta]
CAHVAFRKHLFW